MVKMMVDSNIWIFSELEDYPESPLAREKLRLALNKDTVTTNPIIISEVFHKIYRIAGIERARTRVLHILESEGVAYMSPEGDTMKKAVSLAYSRNIRINDAIIAQQCVDEGQELFTDNVKDFKSIFGLKVIPFR